MQIACATQVRNLSACCGLVNHLPMRVRVFADVFVCVCGLFIWQILINWVFDKSSYYCYYLLRLSCVRALTDWTISFFGLSFSFSFSLRLLSRLFVAL